MNLDLNWEKIIYWLGAGQAKMHWSIHITIVLLLTFTSIVIVSRVIQRIENKLATTKTPWDSVLLTAAKRPLHYFIWTLGTTIAAQILSEKLYILSLDIIENLYRVSTIVLLTWFILRLIKESETILITPRPNKKPIDITTVSAVSKLLKATLITISALVLLQTLGFSISGVLAFGGIGGIAVGFAAKDLLANFFGGLMVYLDRPFSVGDWVRSPDKEIEGTVEKIGWRQTCVRTFDKRPLYIPNSTFSVISVENPSRMSHRRIYETIGVRYEDGKNLPIILQDVKNMLLKHDEIDDQETMIVNFNEFGASSLNFFIYVFTKTTNWIHYHEVKQDVLLQIMQIIHTHKAEIAFPTQTLHLQPQSLDAFDLQAKEPSAANKESSAQDKKPSAKFDGP